MTDRLFTDGTPAKTIFSFGGGVQSHAVLVLAAQGKVQYDAFVFSNVGADSENPDTLTYIERVTKPFCAKHGLAFIEVAKRNRKGEIVTLRSQVMRSDLKSVVIPAYADGGGPANRNCTNDWKIKIIDQWIKKQKWPHVVVGLGISTDEWTRMRDTDWHDAHITASEIRKPFGFWKRREYPLMTLNIDRMRSHRIISEAGLPTPPKSSCYFCPHMRPNEWIEMRANQPELFEKAVEIEEAINAKGLPRKYVLSTLKKPLRDAVGEQATMFPEDDRCDSGYCWT